MHYFTQNSIREHIPTIEKVGIVTVPDFLKPIVRAAMLRELKQYSMLECKPVKGKVKQCYTFVKSFPESSVFVAVKRQLEDLLEMDFAVLAAPYLSEQLRFNDLVVQRYEPGKGGVAPHMDGESCINLVAVLVLEGQGRFCICEDRDGKNPISIRNYPGDLLLMRGNKFLGANQQLLHFVDQVSVQRTTFALRHVKMETKTKGGS